MAPVVRICPHCGNYVTGVHEKSFGNKVARTGMKSVAKAGYAGTGAAIGSIFGPLGTLIGGAAGWAASTIMNENLDETADLIQDSTVGIEYTFRCPKCGHVWTGQQEKVDIWVEHNICKNHVWGMLIHTKFCVHGMKGRTGQASAYFYLSDGTQLKDYNDSEAYKTNDGFVSTYENFVPEYDDTVYQDLQLFMPYNELHLEGSAEGCYLGVIIWCEDTPIMQSDRVDFNVNNLQPVISILNTEHGVEENGEYGFRVHVKFTVEQMVGVEGQVGICFFYEDGTPYQYQGQNLWLIDDEIFKPIYESTTFTDYKVFCPYKYFEDQTPGRNIYYHVVIAHADDELRAQNGCILVSVADSFHFTE